MKPISETWLMAAARHPKEGAYWRAYLADEPAAAMMPPDLPDHAGTHARAVLHQPLPAKVAGPLLDLSRGNDAALHVVLGAVVTAFLHKMSGADDLVTATPLYRQKVTAELINTVLPLRQRITASTCFMDLLRGLKGDLKAGVAHYQYPIEVLSRDLGLEGRLCETAFWLTNVQDAAYLDRIEVSFGFGFTRRDRDLEISLTYDKERYLSTTVAAVFSRFQHLATQLAAQPNRPLAELTLITDAERDWILNQVNDTVVDYPRDTGLAQLFDQIAAQNPDAVALVVGDRESSYAWLRHQALVVAEALVQRGLRAGEPVGVMTERGWEMIVAVLGVLYAGGCYLPVESHYPEQRRDFMLNDAGARLLVTDQTDLEGAMTVVVREDAGEAPAFSPVAVSGSDPAYIMYTSGSTGTPKGVQVPQRAVARLVLNTNFVALGPNTRILQTGAPVFDAATFEIWGALLNGGRLVLVPREALMNAASPAVHLRRHKINTLWLTVALFNQWVEEDVTVFSGVSQLLVGGDALSPRHVSKVLDQLPDCRLINGYGPTENTTFSACHRVTRDDLNDIPIGRPIANSTCLVVDAHLQLLPPGVYGELLVGGDGLALGYLNRPELNREKFIDNPFGEGRLYRTGDRARFNADGTLAFGGRLDQQVKIRGYRIEPGEIQNCILDHAAVSEAVVLVRANALGEKFLAAWYAAGPDLEPAQLKAYLQGRLPEYMVPAVLMRLDKLPLTANGKVDYRALPEPLSTREVVAPQTQTQRVLAAIWADLLKVPLDSIGIDDNFFEMGGHSLNAATMAARIHQDLAVAVGLTEVFQYATIRRLADHLDGLEKQAHTGLDPAPARDHYPLSSAQARLFLAWHIHPESLAYNIPLALMIKGRVDAGALERGFHQLIARHEILRTRFEMRDETPVQIVLDEVPFQLERIITDQVEAAVNNFIQPFDLEHPPLLRAGLISVGQDHHVLVMDLHHIVADGVSMGLLMTEFSHMLRGENLDPVRLHYKDYAWAWSRPEQRRRIQDHRTWWLEQFADPPPVLELPYDFKRPNQAGFTGAHHIQRLNGARTAALNAAARKADVTLFSALLTLQGLLLQRLSGAKRLVIGTPTAGRPHADLERMLGVFINTPPLLLEMDGALPFCQLAKAVHQTVIASLDHAQYPYEDLIEDVQPVRAVNRNPLFDTLFTLQNMAMPGLSIPGVDVTPYPFDVTTAKYDLTLTARQEGEGLFLDWGYASALFTADTIARFADYYTRLLEAVSAQPDVPCGQLQIMGLEERTRILESFNQTHGYYPRLKCLQEVFAGVAAAHPDKPAVAAGERSLTYAQLNQRADALAGLLDRTGFGRGSIAALDARPCLELAVAVLGVWKAGGAWLPIDPEFPSGRVDFMLEDCAAKVLLTYQDQGVTTAVSVETILLDAVDWNAASGAPMHLNPPKDPAYVIYTSGTTGRPKGVVLTHRNLLNYVSWIHDLAAMDAADVGLLTSSFAFDLGYTSFFPPLFCGGQVHLIPKATYMDPDDLLDYVVEHRVTFLKMTPSLLATVTDSLDDHDPADLRLWFLGGEKIDPSAVALLHAKKPHIKVINHYGPTEATIGCLAFPIDFEDFAAYENRPVIGRPALNTSVFILDEHREPVPVGVMGELAIAGDGLAAGYHNRPELTAAKFLDNPFERDRRLYLTGDLARWTPAGTVELAGRMDHQVKIRGYRIELDEIKNALLAYAAVNDAAVIVVGDDPKHAFIAAYYRATEDVDQSDLKQHLAKALPVYMTPSALVQLAAIPLTPNGKLDRAALPEVDLSADRDYTAPRSLNERRLAEVWAEVLGLERVGLHDGFFDLGGDSIKAIQIAGRIKRFGLKLEVADLFTHPTLADCAPRLKKLTRKISNDPVTGPVTPTPIMETFLKANFDQEHHYNQAVMWAVTQPLDVAVVGNVFTALTTHHDALRLRVRADETGRRLVIVPPGEVGFELHEHTLTEAAPGPVITARANEIQRQMGLADGPLVQVGVFHTEEGDFLLICIHHLAVDGISWRVILEDFQTAYQQLQAGRAVALPNKTDSFVAWSAALARYAQSNAVQQQARYWRKVIAGPFGQLPRSGDGRTARRHVARAALNETLTKNLLTRAGRAFKTEINDLLLTALQQALSPMGADAVLVDLEGHGRQTLPGDLDVSRTVGWFTSRFPVRLQPAEGDLGRIIREMKENLRRIPTRGLGYGLLQQYVALEAVQADLSFNYLGEFGADMDPTAMRPARYSAGETISPGIERPYRYDITAMVAGGRFELNVAVMERDVSPAEADAFANRLAEQIEAIVSYCMTREEAVLSPADFGESELTLDAFDALYQPEVEDLYPLSPMQSGMLYYAVKLPRDQDPYYECFSFQLAGQVHPQRLEQALNLVVNRYAILRTSFESRRVERPTQIVWRHRAVPFEHHDLRECEDAAAFLDDLKARDKRRGFDLGFDPLMRFYLVSTAADAHHLIWAKHHILMDGWCGGVIFKEVMTAYRALVAGEIPDLPPVVQYRTYINWLAAQDMTAGLAFWQSYLAGFENAGGLPRPGNCKSHYQAAELHLELDEAVTQALHRTAAAQRTTFNTLFQTVWGMLSARYTSRDDVVMGAVVSGRPPEIEGIETMVGLMINTVPVRVTLSGASTFEQLLRSVQDAAIAAKPFEYVALADIQRAHPLKNNLLDHLLVFENYPVAEALSKEKDGAFEIVGFEATEQTNYDFNIIAATAKTTSITFNYNSGVYHPEFIAKVAVHFENGLRRVADGLDFDPLDVEIVTAADREQILIHFNNTDAPYSREKTLEWLFEERVAQNPDAPALYFGEECLSYAAFNARANRLAHRLRMLGVRPGAPVGILAERSFEMMIGIYAILKAGGVYLPLAVDAPAERLAFILADSQCKLVLAQNRFTGLAADVATLDLEHPGDEDMPQSNPSRLNRPDSLAYFIYTSGSTGRPKGVMIEHHSAINRLEWMQARYPIGTGDKILQKTPTIFDVSIWELFWWGLEGAALVLAPAGAEKDPAALVDLIEHHFVTTMHFVPSMKSVFLEYVVGADVIPRLASLRHVFASGEALSLDLAVRFRDSLYKAHGTQLINLYGPTEAAVDVSYFDCFSAEPLTHVPIGKPVPNTTLLVLDPRLKLNPVGVPGELFIGGVQVARGYLNRDELTAEKFIANPYRDGDRLYRTGDLARWLPDGNLEYLGRIDFQVKIRGYRIELGEIENLLLKHPLVSEVLVMADAAQTGLTAYLVGAVAADDLRSFAAAHLPDYMVPGRLVFLEQMPLTSNGKVDRRALAEMRPASDPSGDFVAPTNAAEATMTQIWADLLDLERVGVTDNFFNIGGDSIRAIRLINRIRENFQVELTLADLYESPTPAALTVRLEQTDSSGRQALVIEVEDDIRGWAALAAAPGRYPFAVEDAFPMSDISKGMIYYTLRNPESGVYHDQLIYQFAEQDFQPDQLRACLHLLAAKHAILRSVFDLYNFDEPLQVVLAEPQIDYLHIDLSNVSPEAQRQRVAANLAEDMAQPFAPLEVQWRYRTFDLGAGDYAAVLICHHAVLDGWSMAAFTTELNNLMRQPLPRAPLSPPANSYRAFVVEQMVEQRMEDNRQWWLAKLADYKRLNLDLNGEVSRRDAAVKPYRAVFGKDYDALLRTVAGQRQTSVRNLSLAAFAAMLHMLAREDDVLFGMVVNNRPLCEDGDKILGCFLNTIPLRLSMAGGLTWEGYRALVDDELVAYARHDRLSLYQILNLIGEKSGDENPLFDALFNFIDFHIYQDLERDPEQTVQKPLELDNYQTTNTLLDLTVNMTFGNYELIFLYDNSRFNAADLQRLCGWYRAALDHILDRPDAPFGKDAMMGPEAKAALLAASHGPQLDYPSDKTFGQLFMEQAQRTPEVIAVRFGLDTITYRELAARADATAARLIQAGVGANQFVGILAERGIDRMVGVLGVIRAGAAYLPLDPAYPADRLAYMLADSGADTLLASRDAWAGFQAERAPQTLLFLDQVSTGRVASYVEPSTGPLDAVYMIYTSGSTGRPKGVVVSHRNFISIAWAWRHEYLPREGGYNLLQMAGFSFDVFSADTARTLLNGGTMVVCPEERLVDPSGLVKLLNSERITMLDATPPLLVPLLDYVYDQQLDLPHLKLIILGSDVLHAADYERLQRRFGDRIRLLNCYGVTEAAIDSSFHDAGSGVTAGSGNASIGKPFPNVSLYVVDERDQLQPIDVPGELLIAGDGVALGYHNRPDLTALKFGPFQPTPGEAVRVYRTGDLVRRRASGDLDFLGRIDFQVKIRGYRIEPGEIEDKLLSHPKVAECAVAVCKVGGSDVLAAWYTAADAVGPEALAAYLSQSLPEYMVPSHFMALARMPLTANGKLDRKGLPAVEAAVSRDYQAPRNDTQRILCEIWAELLGCERVGITDHFFELGGDSIKAVQLFARLGRHGLKVPMEKLFSYPTIEQLSDYVTGASRDIPQGPVTGPVPLTPIQHWFLTERKQGAGHYNQTLMMHGEDGFDETIVEAVLAALAQHHDALRTVFPQDAEGGVILEPEALQPSVRVFDLTHEADPGPVVRQLAGEIQAGADLAVGPLMRAALFRTQGGDHLMLCIHHLVVDGVSWRILMEDFTDAYRQRYLNRPIALPSKTDAFQYWSEKLSVYASSEPLLDERAYWADVIATPVRPLPVDRMAAPHHRRTAFVSGVQALIEVGTSRALLRRVNRVFKSDINGLLLTGLGMALAEWCGVDRTLISLEGHGREDILEDVDISRTVGWFTTEFPLVLDCVARTDVAAGIRAVTERLASTPHKGIGYGVLRYLTPADLGGGEALAVVPELSFNYLGQVDQQQGAAGRVKVSPFSSGDAVNPDFDPIFKIAVNGYLQDGRLNFTLAYNTHEYDQAAVQRLADLFREALDHIADQGLELARRQGFLDRRAEDVDLDAQYMVLNENAPGNLFCFPPAIAHGLSFMDYGRRLPEHTLYAFDFIESIDPVSSYIDIITRLQPRGPYHFLAYSGGGKAAYAVALEMAARGLELGSLILLDCEWAYSRNMTDERLRESSAALLQGFSSLMGGDPDTYAAALEKMVAYGRFLFDYIVDQPIPAEIHLIKSREPGENFVKNSWADFTSRNYRDYQGHGLHHEMGSAGFIEHNAAIIRAILDKAGKGGAL